MNKEKLYFEEIACNINGCDWEQLFTKTRFQHVVYARYFCIYYMREVLKYSFNACGARYGKDHATAIHAYNVASTLKEIDRKFKPKFKKFMEEAKKGKAYLEHELTFDKVLGGDARGNHVTFIHNVLKAFTRLEISLYNFIDYEEDYAEILDRINIIEHGLNELKTFFSYDNKGVVDTENK